MNNKRPFNQFAPDVPVGATVAQKWYRRHIIMDHVNKFIYLQIMYDGAGYISSKEFGEISAGAYWQYIPKEIAEDVRLGINHGYKVKPIVFAGGNVGEEHTVLQIVDAVSTNQPIENANIMNPVDEKRFS